MDSPAEPGAPSQHDGHSHGTGTRLEPEANSILERGLQKLLDITDGLDFRNLPSEKYPLPLLSATYSTPPNAKTVREDVKARASTDPVSVLEYALVLLELYECNQPGIEEHVLEDMPFIRACFSSKRCNGWIAVIGDTDRDELEAAINSKWQFRFHNGRSRETGVYPLLNMLARYAFVYGRAHFGNIHDLSHFVEDHCPGLLVCRGNMTDLELALSLAAMKMGVPAVVPTDYPFPLGRTIKVDSLEDITEAVVGFANIRQLLTMPELPQFPDYCDQENRNEEFEPAAIWGDAPDSFYIVKKGGVDSPEVSVAGTPQDAMGVVITVDGEPLDAFDRRHIERWTAGTPSMMKGVMAVYEDECLKIKLAEGVTLDTHRIGEVLLAAVRHNFPKLDKIKVEVIFDKKVLSDMAPQVRREKEERARSIKEATEESVEHFYQCVACSPFAPDHVCVLTPERPPQCARAFESIKTGALYGYDDMSNIHHSKLHRDINSFRVIEKGTCIDAECGEWSGVNEQAAKHTHGRTTHIQLHALNDNPHTGCGCFRLIMFKTEKPKPGIGIMAAGYEGRAPDGRNWRDLHYDLAGKQAPGIAGASAGYLFSPKFLKAHGGWKAVVWVSPKVANIMDDALPQDISVGENPESATG